MGSNPLTPGERVEAPQKRVIGNLKDSSQAVKNDTSGMRSEFNPTTLTGPKELYPQEQNGHSYGGQEALDALKTSQDAPAQSPRDKLTHASEYSPLGANAARKETRNEESKVTEESANNIREELKLHYLRTRSPEVAASCLYGKNPEGKLLHSLSKSPIQRDECSYGVC